MDLNLDIVGVKHEFWMLIVVGLDASVYSGLTVELRENPSSELLI